MYACLMTFFLANFIEGQLLSTGAFEMDFNGRQIWSKLRTGRIPQPHEIFSIMDSLMAAETIPSDRIILPS